MKKTFLFSLFTFFLANSQVKNDTIDIEFSYIKKIAKTAYSNIRVRPNDFYIYYDNMDQPLNGLYKIHIDDANYFITKYKNGIEDNTIFNFKKSYRNGELKELDIKGHQLIGQTYLSISEYACSSNVSLDGFTKDYYNDRIIDKIRIYQKIKKKIISWKIYYPDKTVRRVSFNKALVNLCR